MSAKPGRSITLNPLDVRWSPSDGFSASAKPMPPVILIVPTRRPILACVLCASSRCTSRESPRSARSPVMCVSVTRPSQLSRAAPPTMCAAPLMSGLRHVPASDRSTSMRPLVESSAVVNDSTSARSVPTALIRPSSGRSRRRWSTGPSARSTGRIAVAESTAVSRLSTSSAKARRCATYVPRAAIDRTLASPRAAPRSVASIDIVGAAREPAIRQSSRASPATFVPSWASWARLISGTLSPVIRRSTPGPSRGIDPPMLIHPRRAPRSRMLSIVTLSGASVTRAACINCHRLSPVTTVALSTTYAVVSPCVSIRPANPAIVPAAVRAASATSVHVESRYRASRSACSRRNAP